MTSCVTFNGRDFAPDVMTLTPHNISKTTITASDFLRNAVPLAHYRDFRNYLNYLNSVYILYQGTRNRTKKSCALSCGFACLRGSGAFDNE
jgi:hypothetical protein